MEIVINHKMQVVEFWVRNDEEISDEEILQMRRDYSAGKYRAVIYYSGKENLLEETKKLILHNRTLK